MAKTIILVHGRAPKPEKEDLQRFWTEALRHGIERDHPTKVAALNQATTEFVYYGNHNNAFLDPDHDTAADAASRRVTLDQLKAHPRNDFNSEDIYNALPGKASWKETLVDSVAGIGAFFRVSEPLIHLVAKDMTEYWNIESDFGSRVRYPMIQPLKDAMDRVDDILVIAHSLGTMIAYDTFWKFGHTGEYRPTYTDKKIDLFISIGSPLADETVKRNLKGAQVSGLRKYPNNIRRWVNIAAEDDYIAHDETMANDYRDMRPLLDHPIRDIRVFNFAVRHEKSNPHHGAGYLIHPELSQIVADWL